MGAELVAKAHTFPQRHKVKGTQMQYSKVILTAVLSVIGSLCYGQAQTQPDNTKVNERDRNAAEATADQQKSNAADMKTTQSIRRSILADKSLSSYAHNIKIISQNGVVTLKGPVKSDAEKAAIITKAVAVTGSADRVTDQISVKH
jgi:hyperosmotically inducible protein